MITPPIIISGALSIMRRMITVTSCTCVTSLVVLVMSVAAPNWSNSRKEKLWMRRNSLLRTMRPNPTAVREDRKVETMAQAMPAAAISNMKPPTRMM